MKVHVIIPVYNTDKYLAKCIDSIFNQTYPDLDVICINDGSTDNSLKILNEYKSKYPMMRLISKQNGGLSSARNAGLESIDYSENSFITFLDSDDYVSQDYIEMLVKKAEEFNADIVCSSFFIDKNGVVKKTTHEVVDEVITSSSAVKMLFDGKIQSHCPCKLFKSKLWENLRFDETLLFMEDQAITFRLFLNANKIFISNWAGYYISMREGSLCQSKMTNKKILCALRSYKLACDYDYSNLPKEEENHLNFLAYNLFGKIFLMMYPRFDKKHSTEKEFLEWKSLVSFEKEKKIVKKIVPENKKERIKKIIFIYFRFLYKSLYKLFLKKYERGSKQ